MVHHSKKEELLARIQELEDESFINALLAQIECKLHTEAGQFTLSEKQTQLTQEAEQQVAQGHFATQEEVMHSIKRWLE